MLKITIFFLIIVIINDSQSQDVLQRYANAVTIPKNELMQCLNEAKLTLEDVIRVQNMVENDTTKKDVQELLTNTGCFLACMYQIQKMMDGPAFLITNIHEIIDLRYVENDMMKAALHESVDICYEQVKDKTMECEAAIEFTLCVSNFIKTHS